MLRWLDTLFAGRESLVLTFSSLTDFGAEGNEQAEQRRWQAKQWRFEAEIEEGERRSTHRDSQRHILDNLGKRPMSVTWGKKPGKSYTDQYALVTHGPKPEPAAVPLEEEPVELCFNTQLFATTSPPEDDRVALAARGRFHWALGGKFNGQMPLREIVTSTKGNS